MRLLGKENFEQAKDGIFNDTITTTNDSNSKRKDRSRSHSLSRLRKGIRQRTNTRRRRGRSYDPFNSNSKNNINSTDGDAAVQQQQQQQQYQTEQELDQQQQQARITLGRSRSCSVGTQKQQKQQHNENRRKFRSVSRSKDKTNKSKESNGKNSSTRRNSSRSRSNTKSKSQGMNGKKSNKKRINNLQLKIQQHLAAGSTSTFNVNDVDTKIEAAKQKVHEAEMETKSLKEKRLQYNAMKGKNLECSENKRSNHKMISAAFSRAEELQRHQLHKAKEKLEEQKGLARMMEHHMCYEYHVKSFSMVVQKNDLFSNKDLVESQQDNNEADVVVEASYIMLPTPTTGVVVVLSTPIIHDGTPQRTCCITK